MCDILNGLQSQAFEINKRLLRFLEKNRQCLVECGLLLPNALARVNPTEATSITLNSRYFIKWKKFFTISRVPGLLH